jgi:AAA+ ATPase superfamily predicted ATPase
MLFLDRRDELAALDRLAAARGGLAVMWGRRRLGKTRLLLEWCTRRKGLYTTADQSSPETQRAYLARAVAAVLPGFADVVYPDWERLLTRLAADAAARGFRGPVVIDELPYLVAASPELPSVLQRWVDHDVGRGALTVALAGSSQRMMQGLVLSAEAPLYGRARVLIELAPLAPRYLASALNVRGAALVAEWAAWGGVPRYWELAAAVRGSATERILALVLDPLGPLFSEPERLLLEESPPAGEVRPLLDAIGAGAHRLSEIAGRLSRPATSLSRPLDRLVGMGLVRRETPYGEPARGGKRSIYRIDDPFLRLWFRVVAPNRAALIAGSRASRLSTLAAHRDALLALAWEDLCRLAVPRLARGALARMNAWQPAQRYWRGDEPEWDLVADAVEGTRTLLGEAWFSRRPVTRHVLQREALRLAARPAPTPASGRDIVRALFVPETQDGAPRRIGDVHVVTMAELADITAGRRG